MSTNAVLSLLSPRLATSLGALLVVALIAGLLPAKGSAAPLAKLDCKQTYEVKRGDTLSKIGTRYGRAANQIVDFNDWDPPYTIYVGQRICIPTSTKSDLPKLQSKYANAPAVFFGAARAADDNNLIVYTYNYPKTTVLVRVANAASAVRKFYEAGRINIAAVGNNRAWRFKLPTDLKNAHQIFICLKDTTTNYSQCVYPRTGP